MRLIPNSLHWRHNDHDGVSNHQPHGCLLNCLFGRRSKKTSKLRVTGLCAGNSPGPVNFPHKGPVTRKMFSFDDVIMYRKECVLPTLSSVPTNWITKVACMRAEWLPTCTGAQEDPSVQYQGPIRTALRNTRRPTHTVTFVEPLPFLRHFHRQEGVEVLVHDTTPRWHVNS